MMKDAEYAHGDHATRRRQEAQLMQRHDRRQRDRNRRRGELKSGDIAAQIAPVGRRAADQDQEHHRQRREELRQADARVAQVQLVGDEPGENNAHHAARGEVRALRGEIEPQRRAAVHAGAPPPWSSALMRQIFVHIRRLRTTTAMAKAGTSAAWRAPTMLTTKPVSSAPTAMPPVKPSW